MSDGPFSNAMTNTKCQHCGEPFSGTRDATPPEFVRPDPSGQHVEPSTICNRCWADYRERVLVGKALDQLGDDFTPEKFTKALAELQAAEPKPDLVYEMDEASNQ